MPTNPLASGLPVDPDTLAATRSGLHQLAEQVLAADLYRHTARIGLRPTPGGIGTPTAIVDGTSRVVRTEGTDVVLVVGEERTAVPLRTIGQAAELVGVDPAAPPVYEASTPVDADRDLALDPAAAAVLAEWFEFGEAALERFHAAHPVDVVGPPTLWPEHFDLAVSAPDPVRGEIVLGVSPGDAVDPEPYAYVSWEGAEATDDWWNRPWGRGVAARTFATVDDLVDFFEEGWQRVR